MNGVRVGLIHEAAGSIGCRRRAGSSSAKIGRRFRLFFRYDSRAKIIVFAWVNDEQTLRSAGSKSDPFLSTK